MCQPMVVSQVPPSGSAPTQQGHKTPQVETSNKRPSNWYVVPTCVVICVVPFCFSLFSLVPVRHELPVCEMASRCDTMTVPGIMLAVIVEGYGLRLRERTERNRAGVRSG